MDHDGLAVVGWQVDGGGVSPLLLLLLMAAAPLKEEMNVKLGEIGSISWGPQYFYPGTSTCMTFLRDAREG